EVLQVRVEARSELCDRGHSVLREHRVVVHRVAGAYGQEEAGYLLRNTPAALAQASSTSALLFAIGLAKQAGVAVAADSTLPGQPPGFPSRAGSTLDALRSLAEQADAPLVVRDGEVRLGAAVGTPTDVTPGPFDPDTNIVSLDSHGGEDTSGSLNP